MRKFAFAKVRKKVCISIKKFQKMTSFLQIELDYRLIPGCFGGLGWWY